MVTPLSESLTLSITLVSAAQAAGITTVQARRFLAEIAKLPTDQGDALLAEARRERIRETSAAVRRRSR